MTWFPIESAHRDGRPVFIAWPGCPCAPVASWQCYEGGDERGQGFLFMWALEDDTLNIGQHAEGWIGFDGDPVPTHWAPVLTAQSPEDPAERGAPGSNTGV